MSDPATADPPGPLRVLFLTDYFPTPANPPAGTWAMTQAEALHAQGADVRVVVPQPWIPWPLNRLRKAKNFLCPPVHRFGNLTVHYPRWPYYNFSFLKRTYPRYPVLCRLSGLWLRPFFHRFFRQWRPDVTFVHHCIPNGLTALWLKRRYGLPYVTQDHHIGAVEDCRRLPFRRRAFGEVVTQAAAAAEPMGNMTRSLSEQFPLAHAVTLHNGVHQFPQQMLDRPRPPELQAKLVILCAAIFVPTKGIPELVQAFSSIALKHPTALLRVAGDGRYRPTIEKALAESNVADRIQLLGMLKRDQVLQEMAWADIFAMISWEEAFATVYLEAASAGKPIVCCNDGGIMEVLTDGVECFAVPPHDIPAAADALDKLLSNPALRQRMSDAALKKFNQELTTQATASATMAVLRAAAQAEEHRS